MAQLEVGDVTVVFGGLTAVRGASFAVESGEILGLIGPNGAGKSTLLNCISGFTRPRSGTVRLDGEVLSGRAVDRIAAAGIGRVFQHPELVPEMSARDNLMVACHGSLRYDLLSEMFGLPSAARQEAEAARRVAEALDRLGLSEIADRTVAALPYGYRKLVEIGRALLMRSQVVLLDEPVAGLNESEIGRLADVLGALRSELRLAVVLVEHNMSFVSRLCDRIVVLDAGAVIASGPPGEALRDPKVMASYLGEKAA